MAKILLSALSARRGGGQTYIRNIVPGFPRGEGHKLSILSAVDIGGIPEHPDVERVAAPRWTLNPVLRIVFGAIWFRFVWPRRHDFDLVYFAGGSFEFPVAAGTRRAVAFRNMLPFDHASRGLYPFGWNRLRHWLLEIVQTRAFRRADLVIFISRYARDVIARLVRMERRRFAVIPHGAARTTGALDPTLAARLPRQFVLYLSMIEVYKSQIELVEAWAELRSNRLTSEKLVLAGPLVSSYATEVERAISRLGLQGEVILLGNVPSDQVTALAERAVLNVFLSKCENCPNILLELLLVGRPLLVADREPMPELGGPALAYVDPANPSAIAGALHRLLDDKNYASSVAQAAAERSRLYSWDDAAQRTWQVIIDCAQTETSLGEYASR